MQIIKYKKGQEFCKLLLWIIIWLKQKKTSLQFFTALFWNQNGFTGQHMKRSAYYYKELISILRF